jgi:hypothetical protein
MNVFDELLALLPRKKQSPNGWVSFNAPCCVYNGESRDTKKRGGIIRTDDGGASYHCFNCGWKASWRPGRNLGTRMKDLLRWLGATDEQVNRIAFECMRIEATGQSTVDTVIPQFIPRDMPENTRRITADLIQQDARVIPVVEYIYSRGLTLEYFDFHWSDRPGFADRMIIPLTVDHKTVGYIARKIGDGKPKYLTEHPPHIVFNLDNQDYERKFVLVFEGSIDAILLGGVAVLTNEVSNEQALQINQLGKTVIVVPDRDQPGERLIERAIELGWSVAFPDWDDDVKDAGDAVSRYGRLATLISIIKNVESNDLKIRLRTKMIGSTIHNG